MRQLALIVVPILVLAFGNPLAAEEPLSDAATDTTGDDSGQAAERQRRTDYMKSLADRHVVVPTDNRHAPLALADVPVLRYTNPVRNFFTDGAVFLWLEHDRPLAAGSPTIRGTGEVFFEFSSLSRRPLECRRENVVVWAPRAGNLVDQPLAGTAPPAATDKLRLRQMRDAARRFQVVTKSKPDVELRLMGQPIYRFSAERDDIVDGAVFAFVEATDPDFLLMLEAHRDSAAPALEWHYTLARLCSRPVEVKLDDMPLWSAENYWTSPRSIGDAYAEKLMGSYPPRQ